MTSNPLRIFVTVGRWLYPVVYIGPNQTGSIREIHKGNSREARSRKPGQLGWPGGYKEALNLIDIKNQIVFSSRIEFGQRAWIRFPRKWSHREGVFIGNLEPAWERFSWGKETSLVGEHQYVS